MATSNVVSATPRIKSGAFWSIGKVAEFLSCSTQTVRNLIDDGQLASVETVGGHRRIDVKSLNTFAYGDEAKPSNAVEGNGVVVYVRVSTEKQNSAGSLERQKERLLKEVSGRERMSEESLPVYSDVASSFGSRDSLNRLVDDIIDGKVRKVYCEYLDRLSRVPGLTHLINHLCKRYAVEVIALDLEDTEDKDVYQAELLNFLTVWCNRRSSDKAKIVTVKHVTGEAIERMVALRKQGFSLTEITNKLNEEGFKTSHGDAVSYAIVRKYIDNNGVQQALSSILIEGVTINGTVKEFIEKKIRKVEDSAKSEISTQGVYPVYAKFCEAQNIKPQLPYQFGRIVVKLLGKHTRKSNGVRLWAGYKVLG